MCGFIYTFVPLHMTLNNFLRVNASYLREITIGPLAGIEHTSLQCQYIQSLSEDPYRVCTNLNVLEAKIQGLESP